MDYKTISLWVLGVLGGLAFIGIHLNLFGSATLLGSAGNAAETYINSQWLYGGLQVGPTGTLDANHQFGTCNTTFYGTSLAATSTGTFVCTVPGINAGDTIEGDLPVNEAGGTSGGFVISSAFSTTSNTIGFTYVNLTGAATSSFKQATTSVEYWSDR